MRIHNEDKIRVRGRIAVQRCVRDGLRRHGVKCRALSGSSKWTLEASRLTAAVRGLQKHVRGVRQLGAVE